MRNKLLSGVIAALLLAAPLPAHAKSPMPGDTCTAPAAGNFATTAGSQTTPNGYFVICDGSLWQLFLGFTTAGNVGIAATPVAGLDVQRAITAASGVAYGLRQQQTLTAAANNDALYGLYLNTTWTNGAFTNVSNIDVGINGTGSTPATAPRTIRVDRNTTAAMAGYGLSMTAGGAVSAGTNVAGGDLTLNGGVGTGTGTSNIIFQASPGTAAATADNTLAQVLKVTGKGTTILAAGTDTCAAGIAGGIRYSASNVQFCNGTSWANIASGGDSIDGQTDARYDVTTDHNMILGQKVSLTAGAQQNVFIGELAGATAAHSTAATDYNTAVGYQALQGLTSGNGNAAFGTQALNANTTGINNTASGSYALGTNTTGSNNTASGYTALYSNVAKSESTALGYEAMYYADSTTTASATANTAVGAYALMGSATASANTGIGNTAIGSSAMQSNTSGQGNAAVGGLAMANNAAGNYNAALGYGALRSNRAKTQNTAVGYNAMYYADDTATAANANNTAVGYLALQGSTTASTNTGTQNTALGASALTGITSGSNNMAVGYNAGNTTTTGSGNILIGSGIVAPAAGTSNWLNIGGIVFGDTSVKSVWLGGGALATGATDGFVEIPTSAGVPTGAPTSHAGFAPMEYDTTDNRLYTYNSGWQNLSAGGGGTPAGSNTQIQYNNSSAFGASSDYTWNDSTKTLTVDAANTTGATLAVGVSGANTNKIALGPTTGAAAPVGSTVASVVVKTYCASGCTGTTGATYTTPSNLLYATVEVVGGGGGGGGIGATKEAAGGGGGGGYARKTLTAAAIGASQTVTVGTGGTAGAVTPTAGGTGLTSSFGALITATGGTGGGAGVASGVGGVGGAGGAGTLGDFNTTGASGGAAYNTSTAGNCLSGAGGSSVRGGGASSVVSSTAGNTGGNYGGGGSGACGTAALAGGAGAGGIVIITEYDY